MGNLLCREKSPRRVYVKGPVKGATTYEPQLFSNDSLVNGTRKDVSHNNSNNKMFFSTPNLISDIKSTISLDARIFDRNNSLSPPIAPPRKKRATLKKGSTLPSTFQNDDVVPNGFKEVFGTIDGLDFIDNGENSLQERSMIDTRTSTPERKLKIGNKKSDKFFGESLSDHLSDQPVSTISIPMEETTEEDSKHISDKSLSSFLMNMLDDIRNAEDEEKYKGQIPVVEPPCIARKRETKHICDDDEHIHAHNMHKNDSDHAPPKPDRDFSKFKSATPSIDTEVISSVENVQAKVLVKRGISRENLPSPPATPNRKKCITNSAAPPAITIETSNASVERVKENKKQNEKNEELNELQNDENITTDLVDLVINKAYGMSDFNYHPEDFSHHTHNDGSNLVTPTSKLAVRKISTPRKISTESAPSFDNEMINVQINKTSPTIQKDSLVLENDNNACTEKRDNKMDDKVYVSLNVSDVIDEMYNKNSDIIKEFQSFLEQSIEKEPIINVDEEKKFLDSTRSLDNKKINDHTKEIHEDDFDNRSYSDSFESTDEEGENEVKKSISSQVGMRKIESDFERRESIKDVDNWFSNHSEMDQKESDVCNSYVGDQISSAGYDTNKIFPFGSTITGRRYSQSDEFFTDISGGNQRMKQNIEPAQKIEDSILEEDEQKAINEKRESSPDHSTLLKFLDKKQITETNEQN
ncbi:unnamed protein product [Chironomus riparius]|uniref:Uncharacterized protein n=1 Tax=Chironomus riparius TaxID=315576 RepID=A0A9N9WSD0_9DIPT|nr:unnamed protein product [Chironomus riparius]